VLQQSYVTTDVDEACAAFAQRFGVREFYRPGEQVLNLDDGRRAVVTIAHALVGPLWLELIQPLGGDAELYSDWLPKGAGFAMKFHHIGIRMFSEQELEENLAQARANSYPIVLSLTAAGAKARYVDTSAALGHDVEYLYFPDAMKTPMSRLPQNKPGYSAP
jgi:hypothetical protein